jgi:hypothetical protein
MAMPPAPKVRNPVRDGKPELDPDAASGTAWSDEPAEDDDTTRSWRDPADDCPVQPDNTYDIEASCSAQAPSRAAGRRGTTDDVVTGSVVPAGAALSVGRGS